METSTRQMHRSNFSPRIYGGVLDASDCPEYEAPQQLLECLELSSDDTPCLGPLSFNAFEPSEDN